jgi:hypothetical protein
MVDGWSATSNIGVSGVPERTIFDGFAEFRTIMFPDTAPAVDSILAQDC